MAKTAGKPAIAEHKLEEFAEDLGKMLGHARNKAQGWLGQRKRIVDSLTSLRDEANQLLSQLGHDGPAAIIRRRGAGRPKTAINKLREQPRKRRKMSAAARKAISDAQKARWAKQKATAKKT